MGRVVLVHLVLRDMEHKEVLLAEPLKMAYILFPDDMTFLKGPSLEFTGSNFRNIMGKDRAYGLCYPDCFI
jgi:hypothetical protein